MTDVAEILHNIADHTETFHRFLSETGLNSELKSRLIDHIILEERENTAKLHQLHGTQPSALTQKLLDHSYILQKIMGENTMPHDLKQELLHHFIEEHQEWQKDLLGTPSGHVEAGEPAPAKSTESGATTQKGAHQHSTQQHSHGSQDRSQGHGGHGDHGGRTKQDAHGGHGQHSHGGQSHKSQESHQSHSAHHGSGYQSKSSTNSPSNEPETRGWTVGPMWNQGG